MRKSFFNYLAFLLLLSTVVSAQIPKSISYQGVLADTNGNAVADGNYNLTFRIYNAVIGTEIWTETQTIEVTNGIFNAILGSVTPLNLPFDQPYLLGISIDGGTELAPLIELTSVPYSLQPDSGSSGSGDGHSLDAADGDPVDAVYVDNDGKVGIGSTTPKAILDLGGRGRNLRFGDYGYIGETLSGAALVLADNAKVGSLGNNQVNYANTTIDGTNAIELFYLNGISFFTQPTGVMHTAGEQFFSKNNRTWERMRITGDGRVAIGTQNPNPTTKLHVESDSLTAVYGRSVFSGKGLGGRFEGGATGVHTTAFGGGAVPSFGVYSYAQSDQNENSFGVYGNASADGIGYGIYGVGTGSNPSYAVYAAGDLAYLGNLIHTSDAKLKENIHPLSGSLKKLMQLKPKSFNFTSDPQYAHMNLPAGEHYGLIAQEVEQVLPELVSDNSHPSAAESRGEKSDDPPISYKGLNYIELIPVLIDAVKEQQSTIQMQQEKINQLESKVNQLTNN